MTQRTTRRPSKHTPILFHWVWIPCIFIVGIVAQGGIHWP